MDRRIDGNSMRAMAEAAPLMSAAELLAMPPDSDRYELLRGVLHRMSPPGASHGGTAARFAMRLGMFVIEHGLGEVLVKAGFLLDTDPDLVRAPDVSFVSSARIPESGLPERFWSGPPDFAIEVISPNESYADVQDKVADFLDHGTRMVALLEPRRRRMTVHRPGEHPQTLNAADTFEGAAAFIGGTGALFIAEAVVIVIHAGFHLDGVGHDRAEGIQ